MESYYNETSTEEENSAGNSTYGAEPQKDTILLLCMNVMYGLIWIGGATGNGLVILVVLRFANMRSVTNIYIFNLAVSDFCFLMGIPFLIVTASKQMWIFGAVMCKVFYIQTSLNWFTSVFTLTVLSADRYVAVCHAIRAMSYRTPGISLAVCAGVWAASIVVMLPIFLYAKTVEDNGQVSCTIEWPEGQVIGANQAFMWYAFCLSFAIPVSLISVFYLLVVIRLRTTGPNKNMKGRTINLISIQS